jgi:hypothetical protein
LYQEKSGNPGLQVAGKLLTWRASGPGSVVFAELETSSFRILFCFSCSKLGPLSDALMLYLWLDPTTYFTRRKGGRIQCYICNHSREFLRKFRVPEASF